MRARRAIEAATVFSRPSAESIMSAPSGNCSENAMDVGHIGEPFVHQSRPAAREWNQFWASHQEGAHEAGIDEFAMGEAPGVVEAATRRQAGGDGDDVGRRRTHVDEKGVVRPRAHQRGAGVPVGRGDVLRVRGRRSAIDEARAGGVEQRLAGLQRALGDRGDAGDAFRARGESVRQFAGHGDGVKRRAANGLRRLREGAVEFAEAEPQRAGDLDRSGNHAVLDPRGLEMRAADVPADDVLHVGHVSGDGASAKVRVWHTI